MSNVDKQYEEILSYAKSIQATYPEVKSEELEMALEIKFIGGKDAFAFASAGVISLPFSGFVSLVTVVFNAIQTIFETDPEKKCEVKRLLIKQVLDFIFPHVIAQ